MHKKKKSGLTRYYLKKMNAEDVAKWVEEHKEELVNQGLLTIQPDGLNPEKEVWYLKFER